MNQDECMLKWRYADGADCKGSVRNIAPLGSIWNLMACETHAPLDDKMENLLYIAYLNGHYDGGKHAREKVAEDIQAILDGSDPHLGCDQ